MHKTIYMYENQTLHNSLTCSSVRPTCPIGGWENTAEGTVLDKEESNRISWEAMNLLKHSSVQVTKISFRYYMHVQEWVKHIMETES